MSAAAPYVEYSFPAGPDGSASQACNLTAAIEASMRRQWSEKNGRAEIESGGLKLHLTELHLALIEDGKTIADTSAEMKSPGQVLICDVCDDVAAVDSGFLVLEPNEQALALSRRCLCKRRSSRHCASEQPRSPGC